MTATRIVLALAGVTLALIAYWPVGWFLDWLRRESDFKEVRKERCVPPLIVGTFERLLAFILIVSGVDDALTVLGIWLGLKIAASWQVIASKSTKMEREVRVGTMTGLMGGILSLGFGVVGGLVARCGCGLCQ
jgi:uncharacterized membrane protein YccF (DUF307 family)